jgi:hypothetical protein
MKKTMVVFAVTAMVLSLGTAFAGDGAAAQQTSATPYNGITFFDLGISSTCGDSAAAEQGLEMKPYNGITYFGQGQLGSGSKNYNCVREAQVTENKPYNGITVF